jgi:hypothetical protein
MSFSNSPIVAVALFVVATSGCRRAERTAATAEAPLEPDLRALVCAGVGGLGGDRGGPTAVAADETFVFLGWKGAERGQEIVAVDPEARPQWSYHRGPGVSGVSQLAADGGAVFALRDEGGSLYKLDAKSGAPLAWDGRAESEITIPSLWPDDAPTNPKVATALAAKNGRIYLSFTPQGFIAVLDGASGRYVTTLTGPAPAQMSLSVTPMNDPDSPGGTKLIDFGVCAFGRHGLAYFLMNHEPAWVMESTTRWLAEDERVVAFTMRGDTMQSSDVTLYTALGEPRHQVQLRSVAAPESFRMNIGINGGRAVPGPWKADAFYDVRALAVDARGQLWIAEGAANPKRFSAWKTDGPRPLLVRELFGPLDSDEPEPTPDPRDPARVLAQGCAWRVDARTGVVECIEVMK